MKAVDILNNLKPFTYLLNNIQSQESLYLKKNSDFLKLTKEVRSEYSFILLELNYVSKEAENLKYSRNRIYCKIEFEIQNDKILFKKLYCEDPSRTNALESLIKAGQNITSWSTKPNQPLFDTDTITNYLIIADNIAHTASNCTSGDNYRPGNFSCISLEEEYITLSQINYMNSRSSAHKDDYSLRKLEFIIPIAQSRKAADNYDYQIGEMMIEFSDHSSKNNKTCGDALKEKITEEKQRFDKK